MRADAGAGPRAGRRRAAAAARGEDRRDRRFPAGSRRRHRRALHRSQVDAGAVRARRSPGRLPAPARARRHARHLHGGQARRPRARDPTARHRSRRAPPRASTSPAIAPVPPLQHLLLDARLRHVAACGGAEVRPPRGARRAGGTQPAADAPGGRRFLRAIRPQRTPCWPRIRRSWRHSHARSTATWRTPIFHEHFDAAELMLRLGFDPSCARRRRRHGAPCRLLGGQRPDGRTPPRARRRPARRP